MKSRKQFLSTFQPRYVANGANCRVDVNRRPIGNRLCAITLRCLFRFVTSSKIETTSSEYSNTYNYSKPCEMKGRSQYRTSIAKPCMVYEMVVSLRVFDVNEGYKPVPVNFSFAISREQCYLEGSCQQRTNRKPGMAYRMARRFGSVTSTKGRNYFRPTFQPRYLPNVATWRFGVNGGPIGNRLCSIEWRCRFAYLTSSKVETTANQLFNRVISRTVPLGRSMSAEDQCETAQLNLISYITSPT